MTIDYDELDRQSNEKKKKLMEELYLKEEDIFWDDAGEYYMQEPSFMDEGENESGRSKKIYLK